MNTKLRHAAFVITFYILLYCAFFSPVLFSGRILAISDSLALYLPSFLSSVSLWDPDLQSGFPIAADLQNATWYPVARIFALFGLWNAFVISSYVLLSCFTYAYIYFLTGSRVGAAVSGIVAGMCGFSMAHLCHTIILHGMVWIPLVLLSIEKLKLEGQRIWFVIGCCAIALSLLAGHPQIPTYGLIVAGFYALTIALFNSNRPISFLMILAAMFVIGLSLTAIQLVPLFELVSQSIREKPELRFYQSISLRPLNLITFIFPALFGAADKGLYYPYFGPINFIERTFYPGLITILLSFVGLKQRKNNRVVWFWIVVFILSLLLALGSSLPFARWMFFVPGLNSFRVPARHVYEMILALIVLSGFGAAAIHQKFANQKTVLWSVGFGSVVFITAAIAVCFNSTKIQNMALKNGAINITLAPWNNSAILLPIILFLFASSVLILYARKPSTFRASLLIVALIIDLTSIGFFCDWKLSPEKTVLKLPQNLRGLPEKLDKTDQRFLAVRGVWSSVEEGRPNLTRLWSIPNGSGYGSLILKRMNELLSMSAQGSLQGNWMASPNRSLDLMAVRYVSTRIEQPPGAKDLIGHRWRLVHQSGNSVIFENHRAMPRAWLVPKVIQASRQEVRNAIVTSTLPGGIKYRPDEIALVEEKFAFEAAKDFDAKVQILKIAKSSMEIQVKTSEPAFLVVSDIYYPGWTAKIDRKLTNLYRTDYLFRGILVPAGSSIIRMEYKPATFRWGLAISIASFLLLVFVVRIKIAGL
jgi:hypothetical protein